MSLEIGVEPRGAVHVVGLRGRLDSAGTPVLQASITNAVAAGANRILFDCTELKYVSSVGLGLFTGTAKQLRATGGAVFFAGLTPHVRSVFEMVGFLGIFEVFPTVAEALENPRFREAAG